MCIRDRRILVLGVAYKQDIDDFRESPALDVIQTLQQRGADVVYHDTWVPSFSHDHLAMTGVALTDDELLKADCVVITTGHKNVDYDRVIKAGRPILDTRNILKGNKAQNIFRI